MTLNDWKTYSEIAKNLVSILGLAGGLFVLYKWIYARLDRATDILLKLDSQFTTPEMVKGRQLIEYDQEWNRVRGALLKEAAPEDKYGTDYQSEDSESTTDEVDVIDIDKLLHFYVLLCGVREAKQVPDSALRKCFRYWLAHYYKPTHRELRLYIDRFYPTLSEWLKEDRYWLRVLFHRTFFDPEGFGWNPGRPPKEEEIQSAIRGRVLVITGAGISADSGIPTYRDKKGYYRNRDPKSLATLSEFERDPKQIWEWYRERRTIIRNAKPNQAHIAVTELARHAKDFLLVTQNVDDLHEKAGLDPDLLVHIHGDIFTNRCTNCHFTNRENIGPIPVPRCPECSAILRPGVVWFDEELDLQQKERINDFIKGGKCDLVLVVGTTATFDYIVDWALRAVALEGLLIEVNPNKTRLSAAANQLIRKKAAKAVPRLILPN